MDASEKPRRLEPYKSAPGIKLSSYPSTESRILFNRSYSELAPCTSNNQYASARMDGKIICQLSHMKGKWDPSTSGSLTVDGARNDRLSGGVESLLRITIMSDTGGSSRFSRAQTTMNAVRQAVSRQSWWNSVRVYFSESNRSIGKEGVPMPFLTCVPAETAAEIPQSSRCIFREGESGLEASLQDMDVNDPPIFDKMVLGGSYFGLLEGLLESMNRSWSSGSDRTERPYVTDDNVESLAIDIRDEVHRRLKNGERFQVELQEAADDPRCIGPSVSFYMLPHRQA